MPLADLPFRGERAAPTFDDSQPEELARYFSDLESLFTLHAVADRQECKQAALRYVSVRTESLWKTTEAWADQTKTYEDFKAEVFKFYPGSSGDRTYSLQDLDILVGHYARTGVTSSADLGEYHRQFLLISRYLVSKSRIATQEQSRMFLHGLPPHLEARVRQRLQAKFIDHFPDDPYPISDIYDATNYVLTCGASAASAPHPSASNSSISAADPTTTKLEALTTAIASLGQLFQSALLPQFTGAPPSNAATYSAPSAPPSGVCAFCGEPGHFARDCEAVAEYAKAGKGKRNAEGKIVLPSGAMVPRWITGACLRDRMDEWHRQYPGQEAAISLFCSLVPGPDDIHQPEPLRTSSTYQEKCTSGYSSTAAPRTLQRDLPPHMDQLTQERFHPAHFPTTAPHLTAQSSLGLQDSAQQAEEAAFPEHPRLTQYSVGTDFENRVRFAETHPALVHALQAPTSRAHQEPSPQVAEEVYERALEAPVTITQRELFSLAPEVRLQVADGTRTRRQQEAQAMMYDIADTFLTAGEPDFAHMDHTAAAAAHSPADTEFSGPAFPTFAFSLADTFLAAEEPELMYCSASPSAEAIEEAITDDTACGSDTSDSGTASDSESDTAYAFPITAASLAVDAPASDGFSVTETNRIPSPTPCLPPLLHRIFGLPSPRRLLVPFSHSLPPLLQRAPLPLSPPRPTPQAAHETQDKSQGQEADPKRIQSNKADSEAAPLGCNSIHGSVGGTSVPHSSSTVPEGSIGTPLSVTCVTFDDFRPPDPDQQFHHSFLDTGQHLSGYSSTARVSISGPKRSASDSADNPRAADAASHSSDDDDNFAPGCTRPYPGWLPSFSFSSSGSEPSDFERTASDSADNPSAPTDRSASDERYDERIARGEGDGWTGISSRVAGRVSVSQLGGEPSGCKA
jgi:hypothetical protein